MRKMVQKFWNIGKKKLCLNHNISPAWASSAHHIALFHTDGGKHKRVEVSRTGRWTGSHFSAGSLCSVQESCKAEKQKGDGERSRWPLESVDTTWKSLHLVPAERRRRRLLTFSTQHFPECTALPVWESVFILVLVFWFRSRMLAKPGACWVAIHYPHHHSVFVWPDAVQMGSEHIKKSTCAWQCGEWKIKTKL